MRRIGRPMRLIPSGQEPRRHISQIRQRRIEQIHIHIAPQARLSGAEDRTDHAQRRHCARAEIHEGKSRFRRWTVRLTRKTHPSGISLHQIIVSRFARSRPIPSERRKRAAYNGSLDRTQRRIVQTQPGRKVSAQIVEHPIRNPHQPMQHLPPSWMLQIQRHTLLIPVETLKIHTILFSGIGWHITRDIATRLGILDFDNFRPKVRQHHRCPRTRPELLHRDNPYSIQGWVLVLIVQVNPLPRGDPKSVEPVPESAYLPSGHPQSPGLRPPAVQKPQQFAVPTSPRPP